MEDELYFSSNIQFFDAMVQKIGHHQKVPIVRLTLLVLCNLNQINCGEVVKDVICQSVYGIFYIYRIRLGRYIICWMYVCVLIVVLESVNEENCKCKYWSEYVSLKIMWLHCWKKDFKAHFEIGNQYLGIFWKTMVYPPTRLLYKSTIGRYLYAASYIFLDKLLIKKNSTLKF